MIELKAIARLMDYPTVEVQAHAAELSQILRDCPLLSFKLKARLKSWLAMYETTDLMDLQETYGGLFDRGRATSLLLFEHVHGESRDRGQAMVDLMALYNSHGFEINTRELPDYIPMYLEYLSCRPQEEAENGILDVAHILALVGARLEDRGSGYGLLFRALLDLSQADISVDEFLERASKEERDDSLEALDKIWEEEAVTFGIDDKSAPCPSAGPPVRPNDNQQTTPVHFVNDSAAVAVTNP
ncbi:MAG: nitrate reductase molybdenum cofactor assembly chaperone [Gammaproteobacteria bacterium]|nr:MAG: nitrate reductase molybdenum cofactor assembly chaperone [Gammaproteobacteria bacterium]RLA50144.1 MAG: nitrate reductase molybdenum cofactor assembly chaperone [Gammaproteobacteria bacterium]